MGRRGIPLVVLALMYAVPAFAQEPRRGRGPVAPDAGNIIVIQDRVERTLFAAEDLEKSQGAGGSLLSPKAGVKRFEESLTRFMVKDYQDAAEGFFILVTTGALVEEGLHLDAEWYLAEALQGMGNTASAESWYRQIATDPSHPYRDDAVRQLLEVFANTGRTEEFRSYYEEMIASGRVTPTDPVIYSLAKAFYHQKDYVRAKSSLLEIQAASPFYRKAQYWLGTIAVVEGDLDGALKYFDGVAALSIDGPDDRDIYDLALLAGARISLERRQYDEAAARYAKIGGDSKYFADKVYEEMWTFITHKEELRKKLVAIDAVFTAEERTALEKQETQLRAAAQAGADIFLLAFPEHPYTPQVKLLQGHLMEHAKDWDGALQTYEQVIAEYRPVRERFELLSVDSAAASRYLDPLLEFQKTGYVETDLPPYAMSMLVQDKDIQTAAAMKGDLVQQRANVTDSEALIEEINVALNREGGLEIHRRRISEVEGISDDTLFLELDLLKEEQRYLAPTADKARLTEYDRARTKLQERVYSGERGATLEADLKKLVADQAGLRTAGNTGVYDYMDDWHKALAEHRVQLVGVKQTLKDTEAVDVEKVKSAIAEQQAEVEQQRTDLAITGDRADEVMTQMTREGFASLAQVFGEAAMSADMGIVDVYWATLLETTERRTDMSDERATRLKVLDDDFDRIRQQLGPAPKQ